MAPAAIHIVPDDNFVRGNIGQEAPTWEEAELAAEPLARKREAELIVHLPDRRMSRKRR
jgi:hypothetical protein